MPAPIKSKITPTLSRYFPPPTSMKPATVVDDVFLIIEKNALLLKLYRLSWGGENANSLISKIIKEHYGLENLTDSAGHDVRNTSPRSKLIDSYQIFK